MTETSKLVKDAREQRTVLIVEDDEVLRMVLCFEFERNGFRVRGAENGQVGLASMGEVHPDVIITDIEMPVMDGISFIIAVRKIAPKPALPIIAISAVKSNAIAEKVVAAGANQFCEKPFTAKSLLAVINGYFSATSIQPAN